MIFQKVYELLKQVPPGKVTTYGALARAIGTKDVRLIGFALHSNPDSEVIPCHRVIKSNGTVAKGYAFGGPNVQKQLLQAEGIEFDEKDMVDLETFEWRIQTYENRTR